MYTDNGIDTSFTKAIYIVYSVYMIASETCNIRLKITTQRKQNPCQCLVLCISSNGSTLDTINVMGEIVLHIVLLRA